MRTVLVCLAIALLSVWVDTGVRVIAKKEATLPMARFTIPGWLDEAITLLLSPLYIVVAVFVGAWVWTAGLAKRGETNGKEGNATPRS